ncbi:MAG TPA: hypothetical protein PK247_10470, partial [Candidatus Goldiibacteriota bacterium]|nr:hypothetical protein [Candidatus Goldiibacteriota bacterium]
MKKAARVFMLISVVCGVFSGISVASDAFTAFDPADKKFIYNSPEDKEISPELKKHARKSALRGRQLFEFSEKELSGLKRIISPSIDIKKHTKASVVKRRVKDNVLRVELNNKEDGQWYRLSADIPEGYTVKKILRDNGTEIVNSTSVDRKTGKTSGEELWYVEGDKVYFFDDPVNGYSVVLSPPQASSSIMVEEPLQSAGQISAIIYPYNGEQNLINGIDNIDHLGRDGDNDLGNDIDENAGGKLALRYTYGGNTYQYGNPATSITRDFAHVSTTYKQLNVTPWGETEAVISTIFQTTNGAPELPFI